MCGMRGENGLGHRETGEGKCVKMGFGTACELLRGKSR